MKEALSDEAPGIGLATLTLSHLASKTLSTTQQVVRRVNYFSLEHTLDRCSQIAHFAILLDAGRGRLLLDSSTRVVVGEYSLRVAKGLT